MLARRGVPAARQRVTELLPLRGGDGRGLARLVCLRAGNVLRPLLHLVEIFAPAIESAETRQVESVDEKTVLNFQIEWRVASQRRGDVHLEQPGLQILVKHDVEAQ